MDNIIANAERIKDRNGYSDFESGKIPYRTVKIVHDPTCNKLKTKPRNRALGDSLDSYVILPLGMQFNLSWVLDCLDLKYRIF